MEQEDLLGCDTERAMHKSNSTTFGMTVDINA